VRTRPRFNPCARRGRHWHSIRLAHRAPRIHIFEQPACEERGDESLNAHRCRCWACPMRLRGRATRQARRGDCPSRAANTARSPTVSFCPCTPPARRGVFAMATIGVRSTSLSPELDRMDCSLSAMVKHLIAASLGKIPTTSARRLTSLFNRSSGLVLCNLLRRCSGKSFGLIGAVLLEHGRADCAGKCR
jgi:hypothetical protein